MSLAFISGAWAKVVGPCLASVTSVEEYGDGILWVAAASGSLPGRSPSGDWCRPPFQAIRVVGLAPRLVK